MTGKAGVTMRPLFLALPDVAHALSVSQSVVKKLVRENDFPKPRLLSPRRVGWLVTEIEEWALSRPQSNLLPPPSGESP